MMRDKLQVLICWQIFDKEPRGLTSTAGKPNSGAGARRHQEWVALLRDQL